MAKPRIEIWMQDSPVKGCRIQRLRAENDLENSPALFWIEEDGRESYRYGRQELIAYQWVFVELEN